MSWVFQDAREAFSQYTELWDEINKTQGNHILLDSLFVEPLVHYFAPPGTLLGISGDSKNPGMVLVNKTKAGFWQTFQPAQGPLGLLVLGNKATAVEQMYALMWSLPGYALGFGVLQQDPDFSVFSELHQSPKLEIVEYIQTSRLTLTGTFEEYWGRRSKNLIHNLARQRRRLAEQGRCFELVADRDPDRVAGGVQEYGELEGTGWKGKQGTAVTADNRQGAFYREVLENFCKRGEGVIYRLLLDGQTVAADLCLERDGRMVILKTSYNESIKGVSLGLLLHQEIFQALFAEGRIKELEFYGRVRDWHTKWTNEIRTMYHINFYRHDWVAVGRRLLKAPSKLLEQR